MEPSSTQSSAISAPKGCGKRMEAPDIELVLLKVFCRTLLVVAASNDSAPDAFIYRICTKNVEKAWDSS